MPQIGEVRQELSKDLKRAVDRCVNQNAWRPGKYWILVVRQFKKADRTIQLKDRVLKKGDKALHTQLMLLNILPSQVAQGVLNSILIEVDNQQGRLDYQYVLPADQDMSGVEGEEVPYVLQSVHKAGIVPVFA